MGVGVFCDEFQGHEVDPDACIAAVTEQIFFSFFFARLVSAEYCLNTFSRKTLFVMKSGLQMWIRIC